MEMTMTGMPVWRVSEPHVTLWIDDIPLAYTPAYGPKLVFKLSYSYRADHGREAGVFSLGKGWNCSWLSCITPGEGSTDGLNRPEGGYKSLTPDTFDYHFQASLAQPLSAWTPYTVAYPDGSKDTYGFYLTNAQDEVLNVFLSQRTDPQGQSLTFTYAGYDPAAPVARLLSVTDAEGRSTLIYYTTNHPWHTNLISSVVDPFGRTTYLEYDEYAMLTNIVDVAGLTNSFTYDGTLQMTSMTTPYGTTTFTVSGGPGQSGRGVEILEPNGGKHLFVSMNDAPGVPNSATEPITTGFANTFDGADLQYRNTFYWSPLQYQQLSTDYTSTGVIGTLTTNDYLLARMRHWLTNSASWGRTLSLERRPSDDGTNAGQIVWYDYAGKSADNAEGTSIMPLFEAVILGDGSTRFTRTERNGLNQPTVVVSTYSKTDGSIGLRTNTYTYEANGIDLKLHVDAGGHQVVSNWFNNAYHQPDASYNALNEETKFTYNGNNRQVTSVKRPSGLTTTNIYFPSGDYEDWLDTTIELEISRTNSYTYADGLVRTHTDERGLTTTHYWDALQRPTGTSYPDSTTTSNRYTALDITATKDRLGFWSYFGYNQIRRRTAETNANGVITLYSYCSCGSLDAVIAAFNTPQQETTSYFYDLQGRRTLTLLPDGTGVTNGFDALGQLEWSDDGTGTRSFFYNNNQGMLTNIATFHGDLQRTIYDIEDRPMWVTDANGVVTTNLYDELGRLTKRLWNGGGETNYYRLNTSGPTNFANALGQTNWFVYDPAGRKTYETNANNETISYTYNSSGALLTLKDGRSLTTTWTYNPYGRVTNKLDQSSQEVFRYKYDPNGRLTNRWTPAKGTTTYKYDPVGNLTNIVYPVGTTSITMKYDPLNRLTNMVDAVGTTGFEYAPGGLLAKEDGPWSSDTVTNGYTKRLRHGLGLLQPTGWWTNSFKYDLARRLTNTASPAGTFSYTFTGPIGVASSLIQRISLPGGGSITNDFDVLGRLKGTWLKKSDGTTLDSSTYVLNAGNQRTWHTNTSGTNVGYTYDSIGQLKVANSSLDSEDRGYTYDSSWNLNYRTNNGALQSFGVDNENQMTTVVDGTCGYDANGNLTSAKYGDQTFSYDAENQLTEAVTPTTGHFVVIQRTTFAYDGMNRLRVRKEYEWVPEPDSFGPPEGNGTWSLISETRYLYDGWRVIQERDSNNVPTVSYTRGTDLSGSLEGAGGIGGLLARSHGYSAGSWSTHNYFHADGNGNITALADGSGTVQASYRYDPYGNLLSASGSLAAANAYRFSSKEWLGTAGLYYYGYRFYSPNWQRWLTRDPIQEWGGINLSSSFHNTPLNILDAQGLDGKAGGEYQQVVCVPGVFTNFYHPVDNSGGGGDAGNLTPADPKFPRGIQNVGWKYGAPIIQGPALPPPVAWRPLPPIVIVIPPIPCSTCKINLPKT
jgi:RHS repeat-associated protein